MLQLLRKRPHCPEFPQQRVKAKGEIVKAKEKVAKATLEKVTVRTCPLEGGKQKVDGRDPKGTKAKAKAKGTRVRAGDAGKSATSKVSARVSSRIAAYQYRELKRQFQSKQRAQ